MSSILFRTLSVCWALPATTLFNAVCCHCLPGRRNAEFLNNLAASRPTEAMMSPVYTEVKVVSVLCGPATCQPPWSNGPRKREMLRRRNRGFRTKEGTVFKNTLKMRRMHLNNSFVIFIFRITLQCKWYSRITDEDAAGGTLFTYVSGKRRNVEINNSPQARIEPWASRF